MKKTYLTPRAEIVDILASQMLAVSKPGTNDNETGGDWNAQEKEEGNQWENNFDEAYWE